MKIAFLRLSKKQYGGRIYMKMVKEILSKHFFTEEFIIFKKKPPPFLKLPLLFFSLKKFSQKKNCSVVIRDFDLGFFLNLKPTKNIIICHHLDYSFAPFFVKFGFSFLVPFILKNLKKADAIVVVSKYWQNFFKKKGYKNVYLIYNVFNLKDFEFKREEIEEFKKKYKLEKKPIIYLGNCQKAKGVIESWKALKNLNCHLVTSGKKMVKIPAKNLELKYSNYLKLLKASTIVITMSKFKEGWCRTAHEAMLLKRPVIGSGLGGMKELLEGGKQIICKDFSKLKEKVEYLLAHPKVRKKMGEDGYNFAKNFTLEKFEKDWLNLIDKILKT